MTVVFRAMPHRDGTVGLPTFVPCMRRPILADPTAIQIQKKAVSNRLMKFAGCLTLSHPGETGRIAGQQSGIDQRHMNQESRVTEDLLPTRLSLLTRLKDLNDQDSWHQFFDLYWQLIYKVARRSGLDENECEEVVQNTLIDVSKEMPGFRYDPSKGSFKGWLLTITRRRICDLRRRKYREPEKVPLSPSSATSVEDLIERERVDSPGFDSAWESEWREHLLRVALERLKPHVSAEHFQVFEMHAVRGVPARTVARALNVHWLSVYTIRHRLAGRLKKLVRVLEAEMSGN